MSIIAVHDLSESDGSEQVSDLLNYCLLIVSPLSYLFSEYHAFEIHSQDPQSSTNLLIRVNFPNNIIDVGLVFAYIITVHLSQPEICFISGIIIYLVRIVVAYYFPCYHSVVNQFYLYVLVSSAVFVIGVYLAFLSQQIFIVMLFVLFLMLVILSLKHKLTEKKGDYVEIKTN